jgi:hypothetical protein
MAKHKHVGDPAAASCSKQPRADEKETAPGDDDLAEAKQTVRGGDDAPPPKRKRPVHAGSPKQPSSSPARKRKPHKPTAAQRERILLEQAHLWRLGQRATRSRRMGREIDIGRKRARSPAPLISPSARQGIVQDLLHQNSLTHNENNELKAQLARYEREHKAFQAWEAEQTRKAAEVRLAAQILKKCQWERTEAKFLGHIVSRDGIKVDPD